jgi:hypothetical protein
MEDNSAWHYRIFRAVGAVSLVIVTLVGSVIMLWFESAQATTQSPKNVGVLRASSVHLNNRTFSHPGLQHWKLDARKRALYQVWKKYGYKQVRLADLNVLNGVMKRVARVEGFLDGQRHVRFHMYRWPGGIHLIDDGLLAQGEPKIYRLKQVDQGQHYDLFRVDQDEAIGSRLSDVHVLPYSGPHNIEQILREKAIDQEVNQAMHPWLTEGYEMTTARDADQRIKRANLGAKGIFIREQIGSSQIEVWWLEKVDSSRGLRDINPPDSENDTRWSHLSEYSGKSYFKLVDDGTLSLLHQVGRGRSTDQGKGFDTKGHGGQLRKHHLIHRPLGGASLYCLARPYTFRYGDGLGDCNMLPR